MKFQSQILAALFVIALSGPAFGQQSATQKFTVRVPTSISITAPANILITHDQTEANQSFASQQWTVRGNSAAGVNVSFSTNQPFTHISDANSKRNAQLGLTLGSTQGAATWSVTQASDQTDYVANDGVATVTATSNGIGRANFNLAVTFITDGFGTFAAGDYETTVTGTVTAK